MNANDKILVCCSAGQNRSVHTKMLLTDEFGFRDVLTVGLDKTKPETVAMLCEWANYILIAGEASLSNKIPESYKSKVIHLPIGHDRWGYYSHKSLLAEIRAHVVLHLNLT